MHVWCVGNEQYVRDSWPFEKEIDLTYMSSERVAYLLAQGSHTIVLIQYTKANQTRTFYDYKTVPLASEGAT